MYQTPKAICWHFNIFLRENWYEVHKCLIHTYVHIFDIQPICFLIGCVPYIRADEQGDSECRHNTWKYIHTYITAYRSYKWMVNPLKYLFCTNGWDVWLSPKGSKLKKKNCFKPPFIKKVHLKNAINVNINQAIIKMQILVYYIPNIIACTKTYSLILTLQSGTSYSGFILFLYKTFSKVLFSIYYGFGICNWFFLYICNHVILTHTVCTLVV